MKAQRRVIPSDFEVTQHNLGEARKLREVLAELLVEQPDPEGFRHLAKLDEAIAFETHNLTCQLIAAMRLEFADLIKDLHATIDEFDNEALLRLGDESQPVKNVENLVELRGKFASIKDKIPPEENPQAIIADFDKEIDAARLKLAAKRATAERLFPDLARSLKAESETQRLYKTVFPEYTDLRREFEADIDERHRTPLTADGTEYEMYDDYKEACAQREKAIEFSAYLKKTIKNIPPEKRNEKSIAKLEKEIAGLDQWIIDSEKALQAEKQAYQETRRTQAETEHSITDYEIALQDAVAQNPFILLGGKNKLKGQ